MSKKQTRKYNHTAPAASKQTIPSVDATVKETKAPRVSRRVIDDAEFNPDYTPIKQDLKRIGILAGSFFVILLVLSFIL